MKKFSLIIAIGFILSTVSCKEVKTNKVFTTLDPSSPQYKHELVKEFLSRGTKNFTFNFDGLANIAGKDYMKVDISGGGINAKSLVLINNWHKLEGIKRTRGISYQGAELKNLQLDLVNVNREPTFVYRDIDKIID